MNIQKRLRHSYILMLLIPIILILLSGALLRNIYLDDNRKAILPPPFLKILYEAMANNPDLLLEKDFLRKLEKLSGFEDKINFFVEKKGVIVNSLKNNHPGKRIKSHDRNDAADSWKFYFSNNTPGFLTINIYDVALIKDLFVGGGVIVLIAICALILTNGLLSFFVARSIINPIKILKKAALNIKNEDMDTPVIYNGKDEFQDVCLAFEEMRIRLKDSLYEQLKYEENRKELLSNISHDLKTPITAIRGYIEGIRDGIADSPEKIDKYLSTVYTKSVLLNDLIDRLFLFSKLDLKKVQFNFQSIDLVTFIRDTCEELKFDYPNLEILFETGELKSLKVSADSMHLHRVISNLIDNAVKYCDKEKTMVTIYISGADDMAKIEIEDNGIGIKKEYLPHIFERFYRSDPARSSLSEGSGLGLSIARQIINAHGGKIEARSITGEGTTIIFTLRKTK